MSTHGSSDGGSPITTHSAAILSDKEHENTLKSSERTEETCYPNTEGIHHMKL